MALIGTECPSDWVSRFLKWCPFGERMLIHHIDLVEDRVSFWSVSRVVSWKQNKKEKQSIISTIAITLTVSVTSIITSVFACLDCNSAIPYSDIVLWWLPVVASWSPRLRSCSTSASSSSADPAECSSGASRDA